jgi:signal transduction histidine kinase
MIERLTPWRGDHSMDMPHALAVEDTLANVRAVLMLVSFAVAILGPSDRYSTVVIVVIAAMTVYSVGVIVALRLGRIRSMWHVALLHGVDTAAAIIATFQTGGAISPFSMLFLFVLLAAGYRWGGLEVWLTCGAGLASLAAQTLLARLFVPLTPAAGLHIVVLRMAYLALGGVLIGYMAEFQRRQRLRAQTASGLLSRVQSEASIVTALQVMADELLVQFSASHLVVIVEEEGREQVAVWRAERQAGGSRRAAIRLTQEPRGRCLAYLFPVPPSIAAWMATRTVSKSGTESGRVLGVGTDGNPVPGAISLGPLWQTPFPWSRAMGLTYRPVAHSLQARVFLFLPSSSRASRSELRDLQVVLREVAPAIFNLYLQRRLQSRSGVVERTRISRELHDGVIQSLIGVEMRLAATRRETAGKVPGAMTAALTNIQSILSDEVLNVRDLMLLLKPIEVGAGRLTEHLLGMVEQFRQRTGIQARFTCDVEDVDLPPRVCREVAGIVQEALTNIRKHSGATNVLVRLARANGSWQLIIDDNGRGFDFEGYLGADELEARRKGPVLIKERVRGIHGRLAMQSHPGFGTKLEITIPQKHHA